uniref:replication helicase subunit n=1 Tax=Dixoniella grisea TaxID=35153 RepID=UPI001FCD17BF|nr:replication helicase subunit [Dixoniella grisea]UNJ17095.1 replication helicase subunit [Dixoniella grisea]
MKLISVFLVMNHYTPYSLESEELVLSRLLLNVEVINKVAETIPVNAFYFPIHKYIYKLIHQLHSKSEEISIIKIERILLQDNQFIQIGGRYIFNQLINISTNSIDINEHINILLDLYIKREFLKYLLKMISICYTSCSCYLIFKTSDIIFNYLKNLLISYNSVLNTTTESTKDLFPQLFIDMVNQSKKTTSFSGVCSGYADFDAITKGLQNQDLIILAGRPGMGKTTLALNIVLNIVQQKKAAIIFSVEMSKKELLYKLTAIASQIPTDLLQTGALEDFHWKKLIKAGKYLQDLPLFIDDSPLLTPSYIKDKIIHLNITGLQVIMIDYLQLIQYPDFKDDRIKELSFITRSLKFLARELNVPIIVLSQLSRLVEARLNKRPLLSDLRESGCITSNTFIDYLNCRHPLYKSYYYKYNTKLKVFSLPNFTYYYSNKYKNFRTGHKNIYRLSCSLPSEICLTANHQVFTHFGWKRLDTLERNDYAVILPYKKSRLVNLHICTLIVWSGKQSTYDIEEISSHNFIANQFLIHNSIEQDADLVAMLYREDYYKVTNNAEEEIFHASSKSITEIHIVKHRKGRTGIFELEFDTTISKFNSLHR